METDWTVRAFEVERDFALVDDWAKGHGREGLPGAYLPPEGIIVERNGIPTCAGWLYKVLGVGVCFLEHVHTAPGLTIKEAREAINTMVTYFDFSAREDNYGVMFAHTLPAIARVAESSGWQKLFSDQVCLGRNTGLTAQLEQKEAA